MIKLEKNNLQDVQANILESLYQIRKDILDEIDLYSVRILFLHRYISLNERKKQIKVWICAGNLMIRIKKLMI